MDRSNVGLSFNLCHFLKSEDANNLQQSLEEALPWLECVSINGADAGDTNTMGWNQLIQPLGAGSFDVASVVTLLTELGYTGPIGLQCYNVPGDPEENLESAIVVWKGMGTSL